MSPSAKRSTNPITAQGPQAPDAYWAARGDLASRIRSRIQQRLGDRIRELTVEVHDRRVQLGGRCSTYYSKQLAQHAALGVIEDQLLCNAIEVGASR